MGERHDVQSAVDLASTSICRRARLLVRHARRAWRWRDLRACRVAELALVGLPQVDTHGLYIYVSGYTFPELGMP